MPGLDPGIHAVPDLQRSDVRHGVDTRDKRGHDGGKLK